MATIEELPVSTSRQVEFVDITDGVQNIVRRSDVSDGVCTVYVPHTTAAVTINEGADPNVARDIINELNKVIPFEDRYLHAEGNSAAHIKASLIGSSETVFVRAGKLMLGTWQSIFFCEFDGPRRRRVFVRVSP